MGDDDVQIRPGVGYGQDVFGIVIPGSVRIVGALAGVDDDGEFVGLAKLIDRIQARVSGKDGIVSRKDLDGHDRATDDQMFEPGDPVRTLGLNVDSAHEKEARGIGQQVDAGGQVADGRAGDIVRNDDGRVDAVPLQVLKQQGFGLLQGAVLVDRGQVDVGVDDHGVVFCVL